MSCFLARADRLTSEVDDDADVSDPSDTVPGELTAVECVAPPCRRRSLKRLAATMARAAAANCKGGDIIGVSAPKGSRFPSLRVNGGECASFIRCRPPGGEFVAGTTKTSSTVVECLTALSLNAVSAIKADLRSIPAGLLVIFASYRH